MKAKLSYEFDSEVDDPDNIKTIVEAMSFRYAIDNFDEWLRGKIKYGCDPVQDWYRPEGATDAENPEVSPYDARVAEHIFQLCRDKLWEFMRDK